MKKLMYMALGSALLCSCTPHLTVEVANTTDIGRTAETVTIAWDEVAALKGAAPENIVVLHDGVQVPSQVLCTGGDEPLALIFQAAAPAGETVTYTLATGQREDYPQLTYGRAVPERYDDYAWENNKVAYRLYGPALETSPERLITPGIDVWVKCTDRLVIDEWYATGDYHHNHGDGMDCYKVGVTLGSGSSLPCVDGAFVWPEHNYVSCETLENGPVRTSVRLVYAPFEIDGRQVGLEKIITLDANSHFNRMENRYTGIDGLPVAAGFARHDVKVTVTSEDYLALVEPASDSDDPVRDGDIFEAVILPGAAMKSDLLGHAVAVATVSDGEPLVYYAGSGWSQGGVADLEAWIGIVEEATASVMQPLQVTVK